MLASLLDGLGGSLAGRDLGCESSEWEVAPVLARLCLGWSVSEGERDLFRVESGSGMICDFSFHRAGQVKGPLARFREDDEGSVGFEAVNR